MTGVQTCALPICNYANKKCQNTLYVNEVTGTKHKLLVAVGNDADKYAGETGYTKILSGYHYAYFLSNDAETSWTDVPSGSYEEGFKTKLTAVSQTEGVKLVYTLNGSTPTAKSTTVESGKEISINGTCTLKVGLLVNGEVRNIATHQYTIEKFKAYKFMVYVNADFLVVPCLSTNGLCFCHLFIWPLRFCFLPCIAV